MTKVKLSLVVLFSIILGSNVFGQTKPTGPVLQDFKTWGVSQGFSQADLQELSHLAKRYKTDFEVLSTSRKKVDDSIGQLDNEQKTLNHDVSALNDTLREEIARLREENKKNRTRTWIGIAAAALLGLAL